MIKYVQERDIPGSENKGYGLIAAFALNYTMLAIASSWCAQSMTRFLTKLRACLISALFDQTLHMTSSDVDLSAATVLMNVDVDKLLNGAKQINEIWAALVSTAISLYILYTHLGKPECLMQMKVQKQDTTVEVFECLLKPFVFVL